MTDRLSAIDRSPRGETPSLSHDQLLEAIDTIPEGFVVYDGDDRLLLCNRAFRELNAEIGDRIVPGVTFAELIAARERAAGTPSCSEPRCGVDCGPRCADWLLCRTRAHGQPCGVMFETTDDGRWIRIDEHRTPGGLTVGLRTDLTDVRDAQAQLARSEAKFRTLYAMAPVGIVRTTLDGHIRDANPAFAVITGSSPDDTRAFPDLFDRRDAAAIRADMAAAGDVGAYGPVERRFVGPDGGEITLLVEGTLVVGPDGERSLWSILQDITERKRVEARISHAARHDALTGLPNRSHLSAELGSGRWTHAEARYGLLLIDLDNFKLGNDSPGHEAGDVLLRTVAQRLAAAVAPGDLVVRLGGDEFAILAEDVADTAALAERAARLFESLGDEILYHHRAIRIGVSIGMALAPIHAHEPAELLRFADMALYEAKRSDRNRAAVFTPAMEEANRRRYDLLSATRRALDEDRVVPHYQPIVDLATGELRGFEALCRVVGGDTVVEPSEIFQYPEIGRAVDLRMLERVADDLARWRDIGFDFVHVSINVCDAEFWRDGFDARLLGALDARALDPTLLGIEVTETAFLADGDRALVPMLEALRRRGITLALDDFGTGYASLTHLKKLPVDRVKIDRSFVADIVFDTASRAIVDALVRLGHGLGKEVVAEGIETEAQRRTLMDLGCRLGQGFLLGRPLAACAVEARWGRAVAVSPRRRVV